jgi:hypothetical protein
MGTRGPVPKRSSQRAGHRTSDEEPDHVTVSGRVAIPRSSTRWAAQARRWYRALATSGQSQFFEPSDWAYAQLLADLLTDELDGKPRATMVNAILASMSKLGTTESDRRRMRIEVERADDDDAEDDDVAILDQYRRVAGKG